ncbi:MAG: TonB-dependent receptor [Sinimarinibacterium sp.]|jgi:iron complex outermembrane receptor protein
MRRQSALAVFLAVVSLAQATESAGQAVGDEPSLDEILGTYEPESPQEGSATPGVGESTEQDAPQERIDESGRRNESQSEPLDTIPVNASSGDEAKQKDDGVKDSRSPRIEEIVVTAQKRSENLQDVPIAVSAFSAEAIRDRGIDGIADLSGQVPSLKFGEVAGGGQASIRGVGFSLVTGIGEGSVALYSDGLFLSRPGAITMLQSDVAGIEVLRGPQGTLYGRNATAGVINLITPAAPESFEAGLSAEGSSRSSSEYGAHIGSGFFDGKLRLRASGRFAKVGDDLINEAFPDRDQGGREGVGFRISGDWQPAEALEIHLRLFDADENLNGPVFGAYKPPPNSVLTPQGTYSEDPYRIRTNDAGNSEKTLRGGSVRANYTMSDEWSLASISGYVRYSFLTGGADNDGTSNDVFTAYRFDQSRTLTQEVNLTFNGEELTWLLGAFYLSEKFGLDNDVYTSGAGVTGLALSSVLPGLAPAVLEILSVPFASGDQLDIQNLMAETTRSGAMFTDGTWHVSETFRIFAGLRYLEERKRQTLTSRIIAVATQTPLVTNCEDLLSQSDVSSTTGRLGIQFDVATSTMMYAQLSSGFKSGGFSLASCGSEFKPEELQSAEIGSKSEFMDSRLRLNTAVFAYDYSNLQVEQVVLPSVVVNNADARVYGAEFESSALLWDDLEASLNATILDARYTKFTNSDNTESVLGGSEQDLKDNRLNRSPTFAGTFSLQYPFELDAWGALTLRGEANYSTRFYLREFNNSTDVQSAYTTYNAFVTWRSPEGRWSVRGFGKNLSDKPVLGALIGVAGYKAAAFQPRRTIGASLSYEFY